MITRWFARMVAEAFKSELSQAEMKGYKRGRELGYADGLDRGFDKAVVHQIRGIADIEVGGSAQVAAQIRGQA